MAWNDQNDLYFLTYSQNGIPLSISLKIEKPKGLFSGFLLAHQSEVIICQVCTYSRYLSFI